MRDKKEWNVLQGMSLLTSNTKTPEPSPILSSKCKFDRRKHKANQQQTIVWNINILSAITYTNPSRPQSKGREASCGVPLYFVVKALDLKFRK